MLHKRIIWISLSVIIGLLITCVVFTRLFIPLIWDFLVVDEKPQASDVIIVLSGDEGRAEYGIELYKQGYADYILFSGGAASSMKRIALSEGITEDHILLDNKSHTTYENALNSTDIMHIHNLQSAIVVTSDYHTRRAGIIFAKYISGHNLTVCAVPQDLPDNHWWEDKHLSKMVVAEYLKLTYHYLLK